MSGLELTEANIRGHALARSLLHDITLDDEERHFAFVHAAEEFMADPNVSAQIIYDLAMVCLAAALEAVKRHEDRCSYSRAAEYLLVLFDAYKFPGALSDGPPPN